MNRIWTKTKWTKAQLDGQSVEFCLRVDQDLFKGVGQFLVLRNHEGLLSIDVVFDLPRTRGEKISRHRSLSKADVDQIELHDTPVIAKFRLFRKYKSGFSGRDATF